MPSLRKRVSSYFRQLSFHNELREKRNINENSFITKYLQGDIKLCDGPPIVHGKNPTDLPNYDLCPYRTGPESIVGCYTGPGGGCTTIQRQEKHLSMGEGDIEFIDNPDGGGDIDQRCNVSITTNSANPQQSPAKNSTANNSATTTPKHRNSATLDISSMQIRVAGETYLVTSNKKQKTEEAQKLQKSLSQSSLTTPPPIDAPIVLQQMNDANNTVANQGIISGFATLPRLAPKQQIRGNINKDGMTLRDSNGNTSGGATLASVAALGDLTAIHGCGIKETEKDDEILIGSGLLKSKSAGNPFRHGCAAAQNEDTPKKRKQGKIIRIANRPTADNDTLIHTASPTSDVDIDPSGTATHYATHAQSPCGGIKLPPHWRRSSEYTYGVAHSLYDRNPITGKQNGDPIADCFGLINRRDSAVLAVADGVNWGEKACIAAKSAIHASLHYLNTTLFHDSTLFMPSQSHDTFATLPTAPITNSNIHQTKDVFVALLRAFHCAHDLILERGGMLTTLTVAVVLPVKGRSVIGTGETDIDDEIDEDRRTGGGKVGSLGCVGAGLRAGEVEAWQQRYVCCVCNVGDTLAYVYSQRDGIRELTKGSHDINCNRDMRDALGALGPVDGHNPELSNLTLSITTVQRGDIILVASDGLTDNFDPNVCKFTVSSNSSSVATNTNTTTSSVKKKDFANQKSTAERKKSSATAISASSLQGNISDERKLATSKAPDAPVVLQVPVKPPRKTKNYIAMNRDSVSSRSSAERASVASFASSQKSGSKSSLAMPDDINNPLIAQFLSDNSIQKQQDSAREKNAKMTDVTNAKTKGANVKQAIPVQKSISMKTVPHQTKNIKQTGNSGQSTQNPSTSSSMVAGFSFLRSKTLVDFRPQTSTVAASISKSQIARNNDGIPYVTPLQRYELTLLLMEDILKRGITGRDEQCVTARKLCQELYNFTISLTNAKRKTLEEDADLYYNQQTNAADNAGNTAPVGGGGVLVELGALERKARRKRALERVQALPGKLDHVTVVACNVGMW